MNYFSLTFILGCFLCLGQNTNAQDCSKWLYLPSEPSYVEIGNLHIPGNQVTIEAVINRTESYLPGTGDFNEGDIVTKHLDPSNVNYLLRPNHGWITTTDGFFGTPDICDIELNKTYHVAMVYDGTTLKFYRNGYLMSQVPATGNLIQNSFPTRIGKFTGGTKENFLGYINEVRIWGVARTQAQIHTYKNTSLFSPTTQIGLLAYYTFDELRNKQGNVTFNGRLVGSASINQVNPNCPPVMDSCKKKFVSNVISAFSVPDTVCVNTPVIIKNTSVGATSNYWNFCVADLKSAPTGENIGNVGGSFSLPVFMDYVLYNGNYYGFLTNNHPGSLIRLDFGNSLLNNPISVNLGNFNGILPPQIGTEGIQMVFNEGRWYAIIVSGHPPDPGSRKIIKIDFGADVTNLNPSVTDWGNLGGLTLPVDLHVFEEGGAWYGLTVNADNNTVTRINFTNSFNNIPTAENLGNIGDLSYPTGIYAINDNGFWRVFVVNGGNNTRTAANFSLTRLDFGSSLLNKPTGVNLGNPGNKLQHPRDLTILKQCGEIIAFAVNGSFSNSNMVQMDFKNDLTSIPQTTSLGIIGNSSFPHSISKLFRVEDDIYGFITNVDNNTVTRLKFSGCTNASISSSQLQNPAPVIYDKPGIYNINLTTDEGLPTQDAYCRQVVVLPSIHTPLQTKTICEGDSILLSSTNATVGMWNDGTTSNVMYAKKTGTYWIRSVNSGGCTNIDSFAVTVNPLPVVKLGADTTICDKGAILLDAGNNGASYVWQNGQQSKSFTVVQAGIYHVFVNKDGCTAKDTIRVDMKPLPKISIDGNSTICKDGNTILTANGGSSYEWFPVIGLSTTSSATTIAGPGETMTYTVKATGLNGCFDSTSITITVDPKPVFSAFSSKPILCVGDTVLLTASGGDHYTWTPSLSVAAQNSDVTTAFPTVSTRYKVVIEDDRCQLRDSLFVSLSVADKPTVSIAKSNDINCIIGYATLKTGGGTRYLWQPTRGLSDPTSHQPVARIDTTTTYKVSITTAEGCTVDDSITVYVNKGNNGSGFPVPSAFSPNGDGKNDCFGVSYWGNVTGFSMNLYNRWGQVVFQTDNPRYCWNGKVNARLQPTDVYVYIIKANTLCGSIFRKGTVTIIR